MRAVHHVYTVIRQAWQRLWMSLMFPHVRLSRSFNIGTGTFFARDKPVEIGDRFFCGRHCHFSCPVSIGHDVMFASFVALVGGDHRVDDIDGPMNSSGRADIRPIEVGSDVWVGHGAIILHGVRIGNGAVVGAGAVVTRHVPDNAIVAGNPARLIRFRHLRSNGPEDRARCDNVESPSACASAASVRHVKSVP